ncbi:hypothetical protein [Paenibacillus durus]|uniref:Uncharacterized protein n=1 Tax=Paenibacillus durus ATCC 35681 TaxID=1333534 RepID=A0A0F7FAM9_PAEDU|nr:hypothetical protein [Paenibacillus durus]AKG35293.1 hypothetical protein VK70_12505 [Paenibacillus durus ATCC 35681]
MNRTEALDLFLKTRSPGVVRSYCDRLKALYEEHKNELSLLFIDSFRQICQQALDRRKERIGYITYSMRRTYLLDRNYNYVVELFDRDWFFDLHPCRFHYNVEWAFSYWAELGQALELQRKPYMNLITQPDVEYYLMGCTDVFHDYIVKLAKHAIPNVLELPEFKTLQRAEKFEIRVGEYKGISELVYQEQPGKKDKLQYRDIQDLVI